MIYMKSTKHQSIKLIYFPADLHANICAGFGFGNGGRRCVERVSDVQDDLLVPRPSIADADVPVEAIADQSIGDTTIGEVDSQDVLVQSHRVITTRTGIPRGATDVRSEVADQVCTRRNVERDVVHALAGIVRFCDRRRHASLGAEDDDDRGSDDAADEPEHCDRHDDFDEREPLVMS